MRGATGSKTRKIQVTSANDTDLYDFNKSIVPQVQRLQSLEKQRFDLDSRLLLMQSKILIHAYHSRNNQARHRNSPISP